MFREFFCGQCRTALVAWLGLLVVLAYSAFLAHIKARLNSFYATFYDLLQEGGGLAVGGARAAAASSPYVELGSADSGSVDEGSGESLEAYRARVSAQLWLFAEIIAPVITTSPACKWVRSSWAFAWRLALMSGYLRAWDTHAEPVEGASQRLHEDTQRFAVALDGCLVAVLDAVFTLIVFTPILCELSLEIRPPLDFGALNGGWLWGTAFLASLVGLGGAVVFGHKLVHLEVDNQRVEALLRKDLVLLETTPAVIVGTAAADGASAGASDPGPSRLTPERARAPSFGPTSYFVPTLARLHTNYHALFRHFSLLNLWLALFDQVMTIFPYMVAAPLVFADDPAQRITLGTLIKMSNSFEKVFASLSVIAESWGAVNEFRSVLHRLREFEGQLYAGARAASGTGCLLPASGGDDPHPSPPPHGPQSPRASAAGTVRGLRRVLVGAGRASSGGGPGGPGGPGGSGGGNRAHGAPANAEFVGTELVVEGAPVVHVHNELSERRAEAEAEAEDARVDMRV